MLKSYGDSLAEIPALRDLQFSQSLTYPTVQVNVDREKAGLSGVTPADVARSVVTTTSSSRFVVPNYWPDPKTGIGYQVQVEVPQAVTHSMGDLAAIPIKAYRHGTIAVARRGASYRRARCRANTIGTT